jgi:hypothetical protein
MALPYYRRINGVELAGGRAVGGGAGTSVRV